MLDAKARHLLEGLSRFSGRLVARTGLTPNAVTILGVGITGVAAWRVLAGDPVSAGLILIAGGVSDFLDGAVARATGRSTRFGAILDSVTDRISDGLIFSALVWALHDAGATLAAALALASLLLSQLVSYIRAKAESHGYDCKVGLMERAERVIALIAGLLFGILTLALAVIVAGSLVTFAQRIVHVGKQAREPV